MRIGEDNIFYVQNIISNVKLQYRNISKAHFAG